MDNTINIGDKVCLLRAFYSKEVGCIPSYTNAVVVSVEDTYYILRSEVYGEPVEINAYYGEIKKVE